MKSLERELFVLQLQILGKNARIKALLNLQIRDAGALLALEKERVQRVRNLLNSL